jgi:hypothetical protein
VIATAPFHRSAALASPSLLQQRLPADCVACLLQQGFQPLIVYLLCEALLAWLAVLLQQRASSR